jgi:hypothetical protein
MFAGNGATGFQNDIYSPLTAQGLDLGLALADIEYSVKSTYTNGPAK